MRMNELKPVFVNFIPVQMKPGEIYISMKYAIAVHLCACGCSEKVVTPFSPQDWCLSFDGRVSLSPSIGNFEYPCGSHYFLTNNQVKWIGEDWAEKKDSKKSKKKGKKFKFKMQFPFLRWTY